MQVETITECNFTNTCHVNADMQALILTKSNITQLTVSLKFSNSNSIRIEIISTEEITFYDKSQAAKQLQKVISKFSEI